MDETVVFSLTCWTCLYSWKPTRFSFLSSVSLPVVSLALFLSAAAFSTFTLGERIDLFCKYLATWSFIDPILSSSSIEIWRSYLLTFEPMIGFLFPLSRAWSSLAFLLSGGDYLRIGMNNSVAFFGYPIKQDGVLLGRNSRALIVVSSTSLIIWEIEKMWRKFEHWAKDSIFGTRISVKVSWLWP